jgi:predicted nucleotidyltransferase
MEMENLNKRRLYYKQKEYLKMVLQRTKAKLVMEAI